MSLKATECEMVAFLGFPMAREVRLVFHLLPVRLLCLQGCILVYRKSRGVVEGFEFPLVTISNCV